jgi:hypothetical protein
MQIVEKDIPCAAPGCSNTIKRGSYAHLNVDKDDKFLCGPECAEKVHGSGKAKPASGGVPNPA